MRLTTLAITAALMSAAACSPAPESRPQAPDADPAQYQIETIVGGLDHPWGLAFLPDGDLLVSERNGGIRRIHNGVASAPLAGGPDDVFYGGQGGLLGLALSPDFETDRLVYLAYSAGADGANTPALYRARLEGDALQDGETLFRAAPLRETAHHFGGRLAFLPDGTLLMTLGDGFEYREQAQIRSNHLGVLVRLNPDGSEPADNPFVEDGGAAAFVYSYGHRNMQGVAVDTDTGVIWTHEHGPRGGDELNAITPGANYGWPIATEGLDYNGARISPFFNHDGFAAPALVWTPSIAPSGLALYDGDLFPDWRGDLFASALAGQAVHRVDLGPDGAILGEERLFAELETRIRHVATGPDGALWLLTDDADGQVLRVTPTR